LRTDRRGDVMSSTKLRISVDECRLGRTECRFRLVNIRPMGSHLLTNSSRQTAGLADRK
jgi:hypothetical protein